MTECLTSLVLTQSALTSVVVDSNSAHDKMQDAWRSYRDMTLAGEKIQNCDFNVVSSPFKFNLKLCIRCHTSE